MQHAYRILITDDDVLHREALAGYLERAGFHIEEAGNGVECLQKITNSPPDLILLDLQMPEMDGFSVLQTLQADPTFSSIPVVFLSSHDRPNLKVRALESGAQDYVVKPFNRAELMARVHAALRRSKRYQECSAQMYGSLQNFNLFELLTTLEIGQKTAQINLLDIQGVVQVDSGRFVNARFGSWDSINAFIRILLAAHGRFSVHFTTSSETSETSVLEGKSISSLLLDSVRQIDEWFHYLGNDIQPETWLETVNPQQIPTEILDLLPSPAARFLALLPKSLDENVKTLQQLLAEGICIPATPRTDDKNHKGSEKY